MVATNPGQTRVPETRTIPASQVATASTKFCRSKISVVFRTAARVLQRRWRERRAIRRAQLLVQLESEAAPGIANAYSRAAYTMQFKSAARIQRVFRAYMQRKVYAFYRYRRHQPLVARRCR